jgi:hypothetical protein
MQSKGDGNKPAVVFYALAMVAVIVYVDACCSGTTSGLG